MLRGTTNVAMPQKAGTHGDRKKFDVFAVDLTSMTLLGSIYAVLDLANTNSNDFHHFCKARCPIYGFGNDFKAHLMAVRVCEEADFWARAKADSKVARTRRGHYPSPALAPRPHDPWPLALTSPGPWH